MFFQEKEMFLYGGVMLVVALVFAIMSYFYTYSDFSGNATEVKPAEENEMKENIQSSESTDSMTHLQTENIFRTFLRCFKHL